MICDYEGSDYKARFWQNADRDYEDAVERVAIRKLLPASGARIAEFGAGFGRLYELYTGYNDILLIDYSRSMLEDAAARLGHDPRFKFVVADLYNLPLAEAVLSSATMIRVIHHIADVPSVLKQIRSAITADGTFVLEYANKRNMKSMARRLLGRQAWSPYAREPIEFAKLNFDFHPAWMQDQLAAAGFQTRRKLSVSYLRAGVFKRLLPHKTMVKLDDALQGTAGLGLLSPSVFTQNQALPQTGPASSNTGSIGDAIFRSPKSKGALRREGDVLICDADSTRWSATRNFFDFKTPLM